MKKNLKKTREIMFKRCSDLINSALSYLHQMHSAIDLDYNEKEDRQRFELFIRAADLYKYLIFDFEHDSDLSEDFSLCSAFFLEVYLLFYNFKF